MKEREISLIDLIVEILLRWRMIIAWMLVGGILMGCLSYVRSCQAAQDQEEQVGVFKEQLGNDEPAGLEYLRSALTDLQVNNVETAIGYESLLESGEAYLRESVKMQINPMNMPRALLTFQVVAEDGEASQRIISLYEDMVSNGLGQALSEKIQDGTSAAAMGELISLTRNSGRVLGEDMEDASSIYRFSDTFRVAVCHISEEQCLQLAEKAEEYVQELQPQLARTMGDHEIKLASQSFAHVMDLQLLEDQQDIRYDMMDWNTSATKLRHNFSESEQQYYDYLVSDGQQSKEEVVREVLERTVIQPSVSVQRILLGMVLFAFIYVFYVFLKYILNTRIRAADDIAVMYEVPGLGVIPAERENRKRLFAFADNWILKLRDRNKRIFTVEEAIGLAAVAVKMAAKKEDLKQICCIGCNLKENTAEIAEKIKNILKDADISVEVLNNVLYDQEAMELLLSVKGVFLLEKAGETLYSEIGREMELLCRQEIRVLGIIVAE
ncbi:MAG: hypothetical protein NC306_14930 [Butyrivibrio sp.]|nr:hypothetical protein [Butyrivibrio sp.]